MAIVTQLTNSAPKGDTFSWAEGTPVIEPGHPIWLHQMAGNSHPRRSASVKYLSFFFKKLTSAKTVALYPSNPELNLILHA